jgi:hypothetical protein
MLKIDDLFLEVCSRKCDFWEGVWCLNLPGWVRNLEADGFCNPNAQGQLPLNLTN